MTTLTLRHHFYFLDSILLLATFTLPFPNHHRGPWTQ